MSYAFKSIVYQKCMYSYSLLPPQKSYNDLNRLFLAIIAWGLWYAWGWLSRYTWDQRLYMVS